MTALAYDDDFENHIGEGLGEFLASANIGLAWSTTGVYASSDTGIVIDAVPATPNRLVTLTVTLYGTWLTRTNVRGSLQVRTRSAGQDPRDASRLDRAIRNALVAHPSIDLPNGVRLTSIDDGPSARLGMDDSNRWMRSHNYPFTVTDLTFLA